LRQRPAVTVLVPPGAEICSLVTAVQIRVRTVSLSDGRPSPVSALPAERRKAVGVCRTVGSHDGGRIMTLPRARSFGSAAADYARHRPGYPDSAVRWALEPVRDRTGPRLLDLAAGTGKLTGALLSHGSVTAMEPDPAMLAELHRLFPDVITAEGTAEEIPLPNASVDAVLVGQAWHWFDPERAL
jgi:hypothetical protein